MLASPVLNGTAVMRIIKQALFDELRRWNIVGGWARVLYSDTGAERAQPERDGLHFAWKCYKNSKVGALCCP